MRNVRLPALLMPLMVAAGSAAAQRPDVPKVPASIALLVPPSPSPGGFIADVPHALTAAARDSLNARIAAVQAAGLGDIGVAILPFLHDRAPVDVGVAIYRTWRIGRIDSIGSARRNIGALILLVPKELSPDSRGVCWIATGTGTEGILTDAASAAICRDSIVPHMRKRDYSGAIAAGIEGVATRLRRDPGLLDTSTIVSAPKTGRRNSTPWFLLVPASLAALLSAMFGVRKWRRLRPRKCPICGQPMQRLSETADDEALTPGQRVEERIGSVDYDVWRCPTHHDVVLPYKAAFTSYHECTVCHAKADKTTRVVLTQPTYVSTGVAEDTHLCEACHATRVERVVLPRRTPPTSSSSSGGGGGGGGGGGSSFGGSGSTSGGGGGSSY